ncbi:MAG: NADH:flavin oxidoreductase [Chloroflexi bacterium]|nr:NADH:flavin oxidoreductase [Chloroflexota bacterium]
MTNLNDRITFLNGMSMKNRFMLAPLTNQQSFEDGSLSDDEYVWLTYRAEGQFGMTMTCASHVQAVGKGFLGQLGIFDDNHIEGHKMLTKAIKSFDSLAIIQLHHAGMKSPEDLIGTKPLCPSDNEEFGAREMSLEEIYQLRDDFISAAVRSQIAGYDGVELHGAHAYIICQFISSEYNQRTDEYGGSLENRCRLLFEIIDGVNEKCGSDFLLGVRVSAERFGMDLSEIKQVCQDIIDTGKVHFLDISLWDSFKDTEDEKYQDKKLIEHFCDFDAKGVLVGVAGKIMTGHQVQEVINYGLDFAVIGRAGILHHDFPKKVLEDPDFESVSLPVTREYLASERLSPNFIDYMSSSRWAFVSK